MSQTVSCWYDVTIPEIPPLLENVNADILIIGAGIGGLTAAYLLLKEGKSVIVVDQNTIGSGETGRSTAHLTYLMDDGLEELKNLFGLDGLKLATQAHKEAVDSIEKICKQEKIFCDFERVPAYLFQSFSPTSSETIESEIACLKEIHLEEASLIPSPFSQFESENVLKIVNQAQFHPLKYLLGLHQTILRLGGKIFSNTHVVEVKGGSFCKIKTDKKLEIDCQYVVVCTHVPINDRVVMHTKQSAYRSYVIGVEIPRNSQEKALYYDTEDPYHYVRIYSPESSDKDILIIGGEDHKTGQDQSDEKFRLLELWAKRYFPMMENVIYKWSGQIMEPVDCLGFLGKNPLDENVFIITGDSGQGITHTTLGATIITDSILKRQSKYEELFDPKRKSSKSLGEFTKENLNVAIQYADWLVSEKDSKIELMPNYSGCVISKNYKKVAVFKDSNGKLHEMSAVCPHLGCIVKWNKVEKTWDCPCHGSRFLAEGQNLNGPAVSPLEPV